MLMKKIPTITIFFLCYSFITSAQINKGSLLLGGDFSAYTEGQENNNLKSKISGINISPLVGKSIKQNLVLGGYFTVGFTNNDGINGIVGFDENIFSVGSFIRKYGVISKNFFGFIHSNLGFTSDNTKFDNNGYLKNKTVSLNVVPGISYKVSKKLHLESGLRDVFSMGYTSQKSKADNSGVINYSKSNTYFISSSLNNFTSNLYFGFRLLLSKK